MVKRCECCGQPLPEYGGIVADEDRGEVRFAGKMIRNLTRIEFELFRFFLDRRGRTASKEAILESMYQLRPSEDEVPEIKIVDVFVCKLRKKIEPLGLSIKTVWGRGYHLEEPETKS